MIETKRAIRLVAAGAKDQEVGGPAATPRFLKQPTGIVRAHGAFETVQDEESRGAGRSVEAVEVEEVIVLRDPAFGASWQRHAGAHELSPKRAQMSSGNPPCGPIDASGHHPSYRPITRNAWE